MPRSTPWARKRALQAERDRAIVERQAMRLVAPITRKLNALIPIAVADKGETTLLARQMRDRLQPFKEVVTKAMTAAHLRGRLRTVSTAAFEKGKALDLFGDALEYFWRRLEMDPEDVELISDMYGNEAARVTREANAVLEERATEAISDILREGAHVKDGIERMREAFHSSGVLPRNSFLLENLVRTQVQQAYGAGQYSALQAPEIQDILWGYTYVTVGDDRVREEHAEWDGFTGPKDHDFWQTHWPPNGFSCRCSVIELYDERETNIPDTYSEADDGFGTIPARYEDGLL